MLSLRQEVAGFCPLEQGTVRFCSLKLTEVLSVLGGQGNGRGDVIEPGIPAIAVNRAASAVGRAGAVPQRRFLENVEKADKSINLEPTRVRH